MFPGRFVQCVLLPKIFKRFKIGNSHVNTATLKEVALTCKKHNLLFYENPQYSLRCSGTLTGSGSQVPMEGEASVKQDVQKKKNRLALERSPYLLQHAENPVDWYPWGDEAFERARKEDKLIFLSVGYSTCHWCHVMERESFESEAVAAVMNEHFVSIKVDREERPDVDKVYMTFVQASSGSGGWPMSVFLTPDLKPVAGGTYFPPDDMWGRPGFTTVLLSVAKQWREERSKLSGTGTRILELLRKTTTFDVGMAAALIAGTVPGRECWQLCASQLVDHNEPHYGGFSLAPKFPQPSYLTFIAHAVAREPHSPASLQLRGMALHMLDCMARGGIHDHVAQGFARYSTDERWHVPHFEKMLYDQAQLAVAYTNAFLMTHEQRYARVVHDIMVYVTRDLSHPQGGFYSAEDADSYPEESAQEKKEGAFCVWRYEEVAGLLDQPVEGYPALKLATVFCHHYGVKPGGNVKPDQDPHGELTNQNVLMVMGSEAATCEKFGLTGEELRSELEKARGILYKARGKRPQPHLDDKIITSWNGLMISGCARAAQALSSEAYKSRAISAAAFVRRYLYDEAAGSLRRSCYTTCSDEAAGKDVTQISKPIAGFVDDYAFLIRGLLDLYETCFDPEWLEWANTLQDTQDSLFWDHGLAGYFTAPADDPSILLRLKEDQDGAEPSGNSVSASNLLRLAAMLDRPDLRTRAGELLGSFTSRLTRVPLALPEMVSALMLYHDSPTQIVVTGSPSDNETLTLLAVVQSRLIPGRVVMLADGNTDSIIYRRNETVRRMHAPAPNTQAAFLCRRHVCSLPVTTPQELAALLDQATQQQTAP